MNYEDLKMRWLNKELTPSRIKDFESDYFSVIDRYMVNELKFSIRNDYTVGPNVKMYVDNVDNYIFRVDITARVGYPIDFKTREGGHLMIYIAEKDSLSILSKRDSQYTTLKRAIRELKNKIKP